VDTSYLSRMAYGERPPPKRHILEALCRTLCLNRTELDAFYTAAGFAAPSVEALGGWDQTVTEVVETLLSLDTDRAAAYRATVSGFSRLARGQERELGRAG
jgi:hypothetical protein